MENVTEDRKKIVTDYYSMFDMIDLFNETQLDKLEKFIQSTVTDEQIDELFFDMG